MDQAVTAWEPTLTADTGAARAAGRRTTWTANLRGATRIAVLLVLATLAILVLLPAAIAALGTQLV